LSPRQIRPHHKRPKKMFRRQSRLSSKPEGLPNSELAAHPNGVLLTRSIPVDPRRAEFFFSLPTVSERLHLLPRVWVEYTPTTPWKRCSPVASHSWSSAMARSPGCAAPP
jgi:hypothetical protein